MFFSEKLAFIISSIAKLKIFHPKNSILLLMFMNDRISFKYHKKVHDSDSNLFNNTVPLRQSFEKWTPTSIQSSKVCSSVFGMQV